jgi:uncharacterized phage-associated protein
MLANLLLSQPPGRSIIFTYRRIVDVLKPSRGNMKHDDVCDYIILKVRAAGESLSHLKLQKLMFYVQAWHLAFFGKPLFVGRFQAWVHGPVNRELYDRFSDTKSLYSEITQDVIRPDFDETSLTEDEAAHIDSVLDAYAALTGTQLEVITHCEDPWIAARVGIRPSQRCETEIDESLMARYYASLEGTN